VGRIPSGKGREGISSEALAQVRVWKFRKSAEFREGEEQGEGGEISCLG
jgi:hypothetical protein